MPSRTQQSARRAFTLVEALIVMAIIATLAALAIPRYANSLSIYRVDAAANQVASDLNLARSRAIAASASRTVTFNLNGSSYQISNESALNHSGGSFSVSLGSKPYHSKLLSATFGLLASTSISFNGYGVPSNSGTVVVQSGSVSRTINLAADSGVASVQ